jgi:hypothetical protein
MEIHGTKNDTSIPVELESVDELREVTFVLTPEEMLTLARFLTACAEPDSELIDLEHAHLIDYLWDTKYDGPDVVVYLK